MLFDNIAAKSHVRTSGAIVRALGAGVANLPSRASTRNARASIVLGPTQRNAILEHDVLLFNTKPRFVLEALVKDGLGRRTCVRGQGNTLGGVVVAKDNNVVL